MASRIKVAVLGATGLVGQRFIQILSKHPWFEVAYLAASERSVGRKYRDVTKWIVENNLPEDIGEMVVERIDADKIKEEGIEIVFSALPSNVALDIEVELAKKGLLVFSNASPLRLEKDVPLINGEVNPEHLGVVETQRRVRGWGGVIVKNPNCSTAILTLAVKPLLDEFGLRRIIVTTMQAVSGAGLRGVASIEIIDNIIPFIEKEEWKIENETRKILGRLVDGFIEPLDVNVYATTTRVPVVDGHLEVVYLETSRSIDVEQAINTLEEFRGVPQDMKLPTAPEKPIIVRREVDRPQPRLDRLAGGGMSVVVGRIEAKERNMLRMVVLGHNTIRGAAGAAVLAAELYCKFYGLV